MNGVTTSEKICERVREVKILYSRLTALCSECPTRRRAPVNIYNYHEQPLALTPAEEEAFTPSVCRTYGSRLYH